MFPDQPITQKPAEVRQGKGKGAPVGWYAPVRAGKILYEVKGVSLELMKEALTRAQHKLPIRTAIVVKEGFE
jgi:large subunit ribosomal protein L16